MYYCVVSTGFVVNRPPSEPDLRIVRILRICFLVLGLAILHDVVHHSVELSFFMNLYLLRLEKNGSQKLLFPRMDISLDRGLGARLI